VSQSPSSVNKGLALALLASAQFVVVLDASIVNVALPSLGRDLEFSSGSPRCSAASLSPRGR